MRTPADRPSDITARPDTIKAVINRVHHSRPEVSLNDIELIARAACRDLDTVHDLTLPELLERSVLQRLPPVYPGSAAPSSTR